MNNQDEDKKYELDHVYDGIKEYDYPAPQWWQIIFYLSIVWGIGYMMYYALWDGETLRHRLEADLIEVQREQMKLSLLEPSESDLMALVSDPQALKIGKETFLVKCASCHGNEGQGLIGPNLTDRFWLHGNGSAKDIFKVVSKGVPDKGMPPWGPLLSGVELKSVSVYLKTLQGTHPSQAKGPQGAEVKI